jgi:hypothetical protein
LLLFVLGTGLIGIIGGGAYSADKSLRVSGRPGLGRAIRWSGLLVIACALAWLLLHGTWWHFVLGVGLLGVGGLVDILFNAAAGWLIFGSPPREWTLSERLRKLLAAGPRAVGIKNYDRALWICMHLIEPWDRDHCGLVKLGLAV